MTTEEFRIFQEETLPEIIGRVEYKYREYIYGIKYSDYYSTLASDEELFDLFDEKEINPFLEITEVVFNDNSYLDTGTLYKDIMCDILEEMSNMGYIPQEDVGGMMDIHGYNYIKFRRE